MTNHDKAHQPSRRRRLPGAGAGQYATALDLARVTSGCPYAFRR
jgi:hypothetical protein